MSLKCRTCCIQFNSNDDFKLHYQSEWHRLNLKRKLSKLPIYSYQEFLNIKKQIIINKINEKKKENEMKLQLSHIKKEKREEKREIIENIIEKNENNENNENFDENNEEYIDQIYELPEPEIEPNLCLFSNTYYRSLEENIQQMERNYGFIIPERKYIENLNDLILKCHEVIKMDSSCLYCNKTFVHYFAVQQHMINKGHCKIDLDNNDIWEEYYDFSNSYPENVKNDIIRIRNERINEKINEIYNETKEEVLPENIVLTDEEEEDIIQEACDLHAIIKNEFGEMILPNGKLIGHRRYRQVYKQKLIKQGDSIALRLNRKERHLALMKQIKFNGNKNEITLYNKNFFLSKNGYFHDKQNLMDIKRHQRQQNKHDLGVGENQNRLHKKPIQYQTW